MMFFIGQLYRLDIDAPIKAAFGFVEEELNFGETSILSQQRDELDNPRADTSPEVISKKSWSGEF